jgi:hypothetical protein
MAKKGEYLYDTVDEFLECRTLRHAWKGEGRYHDGEEVYTVLQCQRCDSYAVLTWSRTGEHLNREYYYTPGYLNKSGERFTKNDVRAEAIRRTKFGPRTEFQQMLERLEAYRGGSEQ